MLLTSRSQALLKVILDSAHPLKIREVANGFQVSERTIKYDLENIRQWLKERNIILHSQPNKGIWISEADEVLQGLRHSLNAHGGRDVILHQKERAKHLAFILLLSDGYQRLHDLADHVGVSRNTVVVDVKETEKLLNGLHLELVSKQRYGIRVEGSERQKRYALECLTHDSLDGSVMYRLVQGVLPENGPGTEAGSLLEKWLISQPELDEIIRLTKRFVGKLDKSLPDRTLISIMIRLCIVVNRVKRGHVVSVDEADLAEAAEWGSYSLFVRKVHEMCERLHMKIPEHEIAYSSLPLLEAEQVHMKRRASRQSMDIFQAARELIQKVGEIVRTPLWDDPELGEHLFAHLNDRMTKYMQGVLYPNPLTEEIRRSYARMFDAVKRSCEEVFWPYGIYLMDADIAYLVLHFQAGYDRWQDKKKACALVVCGTGRGTARFLKNHLESEVRSLRVVGLCSTLEVEKYLATREVDVIISVLPVKTEVPVVIVNPLPTRQDIGRILACLEALQLEPELESDGVRKHSAKSPNAWMPVQTAELSLRDLPLVERLSQDVIVKGYEISCKLMEAFRGQLTEQTASGLALHVQLMVNRLAFGSSYDEWDRHSGEETAAHSSWRTRVNQIMQEAGVNVPQSEVTAILRYFSEKEGGANEC
ncbi:transcription antiterminator [Brevibacillus ruminantium]|uniref:Transcription antiterminator n=1 Tax=Brevibacillus ruminantium TaxID=2950604 RepID=A0ABY4WAL3_9BACL|nr:transcription antiterminator [Brevibacillus ruminantium]USG64221.1 transcription antiterminator [Brevibacillus ruminantium]